MKKLKSIMLLFITAIIWGCAFVAQSVGMDYVGPFTFNGLRFIIGALTLLPAVFYTIKRERINKKITLKAGLICGVFLAAASMFQQWGINIIPVGRAGFITSLYIVIVPFLGIFTGKRISKKIWISVVIAVVGLYLLCIKEKLAFETGDIYVIICAFLFSLHIIIIDRYFMVNGIILSFIQFFTAGILCSIGMLFTETLDFNTVIAGWKPLIYSGVLSSGVGYTFQVLGQKGVNPTVASLILSLESVTSVIAAFIILNQSLSVKELIGCCVMFCAVILAQLPDKNS